MCQCQQSGLRGLFDGPAPPPPPSPSTPNYYVPGLPAALMSAPMPAPADPGLPGGMLAVKFADGSNGFLDPTDGTYYDDQGDDVTGYVQNFGGATVLGPASAAAIAAANGVALPAIIPPASPAGAAPRVNATPTPLQTAIAQNAPAPDYTTDALVVGALFLVMSLMGGKKKR